ncbi:hypothetical protein As57867_004887, partial [Aphanomyces stellatus]
PLYPPSKWYGQGLLGHFTKYKARLVIKGFMQRYGLDYVEIFAPVLRYNTLRLVLFLVASNGWIIRQMDVKTAFLNGYLDEDTEIYMVQPPNFVVPGMEHLVCKLLKAIYGLKQAPRCWYITLHEFLVSISFMRNTQEMTSAFMHCPYPIVTSTFPFVTSRKVAMLYVCLIWPIRILSPDVFAGLSLPVRLYRLLHGTGKLTTLRTGGLMETYI